jgi:hypothetical protein
MTEANVVYKTRADALLPRDPSAIIGRRPRNKAAAHARQPLGLRPDGTDDERDLDDDGMTDDGRVRLADGSTFSFRDDADPAFLAAPAINDFVYEAMNAGVSIVDDAHAKAKKAISELRQDFDRKLADASKQIAARDAKIADLDVRLARLEGGAAERSRASILRP